jgi:crotonobetainyl-CoA:carnitine CoA-transferase CaiB-like acyl-CoA transferase
VNGPVSDIPITYPFMRDAEPLPARMRPYRVADFTRVLAGPWATQILGDQGFDVVKVEMPGGDETRRFAPFVAGESVYFACTNRNKRSIEIDLATPAGREVGRRLVRSADVVVHNFRPGVMERLGIGHAAVGTDTQVWVGLSAFGADATGAGYDLVLQGVGGIAALTGDPPRKAGPSIADLASAAVLVQGVLFGLLEREHSGRGSVVDISMLDVQHGLLAYYASAQLNAGQPPPAPSNAHPSIAPYNLYRCLDGWIAICCANEPLWERLRAALDLPVRPEWSTLAGRVADRERLDGTVGAALAAHPVAWWDALLTAAGVPVGPALDVAASLAHPRARKLQVGRWVQPRPPLGVRQNRPPPGLGEHAGEVLAELGYSPAEMARLREEGAFGPTAVRGC